MHPPDDRSPGVRQGVVQKLLGKRDRHGVMVHPTSSLILISIVLDLPHQLLQGMRLALVLAVKQGREFRDEFDRLLGGRAAVAGPRRLDHNLLIFGHPRLTSRSWRRAAPPPAL